MFPQTLNKIVTLRNILKLWESIVYYTYSIFKIHSIIHLCYISVFPSYPNFVRQQKQIMFPWCRMQIYFCRWNNIRCDCVCQQGGSAPGTRLAADRQRLSTDPLPASLSAYRNIYCCYTLSTYNNNIRYNTHKTRHLDKDKKHKKAGKKEQSEDLVRLIGASKQFHK